MHELISTFRCFQFCAWIIVYSNLDIDVSQVCTFALRYPDQFVCVRMLKPDHRPKLLDLGMEFQTVAGPQPDKVCSISTETGTSWLTYICTCVCRSVLNLSIFTYSHKSFIPHVPKQILFSVRPAYICQAAFQLAFYGLNLLRAQFMPLQQIPDSFSASKL